MDSVACEDVLFVVGHHLQSRGWMCEDGRPAGRQAGSVVSASRVPARPSGATVKYRWHRHEGCDLTRPPHPSLKDLHVAGGVPGAERVPFLLRELVT